MTIVALLVLASLAAACGGPAAGSPKGAVLGAAVKTLDARTAQAAFTLQPHSSTSGVQGFSGTGAFDFQANKGSLALSLPGLTLPGVPTSSGPTTTVVTDTTTYLYEPQLATVVTNKYWVKVNACATTTSTGLAALQGLFSPPLVVQMLNGAQSATFVGTDSLSGVSTSQYRAQLDLQQAGQSLSGSESAAYNCLVAVLTPILEVDIWLDGSGRLVKVSLPIDLSKLPLYSSTGSRLSGTATYNLGLTNFGQATVKASIPPADQVVDATDLVNPPTPTPSTTIPSTTTTTTTAPTTTVPPTTTTTAPAATTLPGHDSPGAAVLALFQALNENNTSLACSYTAPSEQATCNAAYASLGDSSSPSEQNLAIGTVQIQGDEAIVVITGTFCDGSQCDTNTDPNADIPSTNTFDQNYSAALNNPNDPSTGAFAIPCVLVQGSWYVAFTL